MEGATMAKLTSMHFYAWKSGLKTGMYYLRTKSAVDAIKFTVKKAAKAAPVATTAAATTKQKPEAVEPLTPQELQEMLSKARQSDDDCLMCGS